MFCIFVFDQNNCDSLICFFGQKTKNNKHFILPLQVRQKMYDENDGQLMLVNSTIAVNINSRAQKSKENLEYIYWQRGLTEKNLNMGLRRSAMKCSSVGRIKTDGKCTNAAAPFVPLCACHPLCLSQTTFERVTNAWKTGGGKKSLAECNFSVQWEMRRKQTETLPCVTTMIFFSSQQWCLLWQVHPRFCLFTQSR